MMYSDSEDGDRKLPPMKDNLDNDEDQTETPTKRMYRLNTWTTIKRLYNEGSGNSRYINRKIPLFPNAREAAERLAETPEFKEAKNIKVNIDMAQEWVKLQVLKANKTLFVAPTQKSSYLYAKIKTPENLDELDQDLVQQRRIVKMLAGKKTYDELTIDQAEPLDMVVVGCVAVSKRGQRIGKGNGYVDLEIAVLHSLGVITPKTVIATTVSHKQVFDEFPEELFQNYDFTVDLIVTPEEVIRVDPRPKERTIGVQWGLLSSRRLEVMPVLKSLKKRFEDEGQTIELKDEDTDVESFTKRRTRGSGNGGQRRRYPKRFSKYPTYDRGDDDAEPATRAEQGEQTPRATGAGGGDMQRRKRTNKGGRMRPPANKTRGAENTGNNSGRARQQNPSSRPPRQLRPQLQDGVRIRVSNMFSVPFKEFKQELRNRDCYPAKISQSRNGRCLLIFPKREDAEEEVQVDELLHKLADMRISVPQKNSTEMKQINLKCELQSKHREFDENDATSIIYAANRAAKKSAEACTKLVNDTNTTTDATTTDTDPDANTNTAKVNVEELAAEVNAATLLAARAAKAAEAIAEKVLQETKPAIEAENGKTETEDNKELTAKLLAQVETLNKAGAAALAAGTKAEEAAASTATDADATGTEPAVSKKEAIAAMNDAIQAAARATAAVSFAVATLYELVPPTPTQQHTVTVASVQTLTRVFGALLPKVDS